MWPGLGSGHLIKPPFVMMVVAAKSECHSQYPSSHLTDTGGSGFFIQKSAKSPGFPGTMGFDRITVISLGRKQELLWLVYSETFKILSHSHEEVGFPHLVGNHLSARLQ